MSEFIQYKVGNYNFTLDKSGSHYIENPAIDDDAGIDDLRGTDMRPVMPAPSEILKELVVSLNLGSSNCIP